MSAAAIEAENITKTYRTGRHRSIEALRGLSFEVPAGSVFGLLGPNGAGKSTTTKILTTLSLPSSGTARVTGADVVRDAATVRTRIGYVSQGASTDPLLTVRENLELAARLRGMPRSEAARRATRLVDEFGLRENVDRAAGKLSGGTRRRLDVATALVHAPRVLFLDEPTTGLDPESRAAMWGEIRRLAGQESLTVVLTTHYLEEADRLADRIMIVDHGTKVVEGTPASSRRRSPETGCASSSSNRMPNARAVLPHPCWACARCSSRSRGRRPCSSHAPTTARPRSARSSRRSMRRGSP
ncbi:ABC transporter ATP-binding protein [Homoserinibacter gongjuensis]|uniref:ABC transporter ATP-binding protein n=1 Tax=Homoserinibacter gongjuensis TaxID=1162968 RepID=A0ABQ6K2N1_9MICO|nr:ABC transporter ATP-binding protein [Homoserinibacter gongjuensis]GMA93006.1 ABC transporter ATP-binding protein [Homoserinibacter gongjuensis]